MAINKRDKTDDLRVNGLLTYSLHFNLKIVEINEPRSAYPSCKIAVFVGCRIIFVFYVGSVNFFSY